MFENITRAIPRCYARYSDFNGLQAVAGTKNAQKGVARPTPYYPSAQAELSATHIPDRMRSAPVGTLPAADRLNFTRAECAAFSGHQY